MKKQKKSWLSYCLICIMVIGLLSVWIGCESDSGGGGSGASGEFTVTVNAATNGTVSANPKKADENVLITVTTQASPGFILDTLVYRASKASTDTIITNGRFRMPADNVTITATFIAYVDPVPAFDYAAWKRQIATWRTELAPIIRDMSQEEKYGQMTQGEYDHVAPRYGTAGDDVSKYFLGSVLSGGHSGPLSGQGTPAQWVEYTNALIEDSMKTPQKIPVIYGLDSMHGASKVKNATMLPHNVGLGAIAVGGGEAMGRQAGYDAGLITGKEMIASGLRWTFGPVLGVPFDIRWGRTYECYSENVGIVHAMGPAVIRGLIDGGIAPSSKHFGPEGQTENGVNGGNAPISIDDYKVIVTPYRAAIEAGVMAIMASYGSRNDLKIHEDRALLTTLLKGSVASGGLDFEGMIITDWNSINGLVGGTYEQKLGRGINAGIDMLMAADSPENWQSTITGLKNLVDTGVVSPERIDDAIMRILLFKRSIGYGTNQVFWNPAGATDAQKSPISVAGEIRTEEHKATAADIVSKTLVLLKNEDNTIQKLVTDYEKILLIGTGADDVGLACGGWTVSWQGSAGATTAGVTIKDAISEIRSVTYVPSAASITVPAGDYDAVIAVISETPYAEGSGDRDGNVEERGADADVLRAALGTGKPVILIIYSGRPLHLGTKADNVKAIVAAWWPGSEAGTGIKDVLFGNKDFVGKTAFTWTRTQGGETLYPFGHGLRKSGN